MYESTDPMYSLDQYEEDDLNRERGKPVFRFLYQGYKWRKGTNIKD